MANIEIDGVKIKAREGAMVIEAADDAGIYIPRFCYHKKLSIAANCRMCLVEVEKAGKPVPACATPVTDGMRVFTRSGRARAAQKSVMEFLLINHPLDCPICDQGGECELQDIAVGYGQDVSKYAEQKRVVPNKDFGPLIAGDMTRCIHCTRCVRFGDEIAGIRELGATGRGEHMEIGTYVQSSISSELSGNVIDLCPVGALTSKPYRFSARAWELTQRESIAPHDGVGSNIYVHLRKDRVMRVVPRENNSLNETWISDRDRFSYEGLNAADRITEPMVKLNGEWQSTDWDTALRHCVIAIQKNLEQYGIKEVGAIASPISTVEELYLLQKLMRTLGVNNIDHRLRQTDFANQNEMPFYPTLGQSLDELEHNDSILLVGSNIRCEQPIVTHRLRKAAMGGAKLAVVNSVDYEFYLPITHKLIVNPTKIVHALAGIVKALLAKDIKSTNSKLDALLEDVSLTDEHMAIANDLMAEGKSTSVIIGAQGINHPKFSVINALAASIAQMTGSRFGYLAEAGNSIGAWIAGAVPHRSLAGDVVNESGKNAAQMLRQGIKSYILLNTEPELDSAFPATALQSLQAADSVIAMSAFASESLKSYASVILPIAPFTETSGTFVNITGDWQSFSAVVPARSDSKPAWKVLRVLGNLLEVNGFDYTSSEEIRQEIEAKTKAIRAENATKQSSVQWSLPANLEPSAQKSIVRVTEVQMYSGDAIQRRAHSLQKTPDAGKVSIRINKTLADKLGLKQSDQAVVSVNENETILSVDLDDRVSENSLLLLAGLKESIPFEATLDPITITKLSV